MSEMPNPKRKKNVPDAPQLNTRSKNQTTRPGVKAGVAPGVRCTATQMEEARATEAAQHAEAVRKQRDAIACVAAIEDEQRRHDNTYSETANHPADPVLDNASPPAQRDEISESRSDKEDFIPSDHNMDSEDEAEGEAEEDEGWRGRSSKPAKSSRTDVTAVRSTQDSSGTPADFGREKPARKCKASENGNSNAKPKGKKPKLGKRAGLATKKRVTSSASGRSSNIMAPNDDFDAPMSKYGGPAMDDDENEQLEHPAPAGKGKKKGLPTDTGLKFVPVPLRRPTKKELRGNSKKWTLEHLPRGTSSLFTSDIVPLASQDVVNRVWKTEEGEPPFIHEVTEDGPWWGLLQYRSNDWRNGFLRQSHKGMKLLHNSPQSDDESDQDEQPNQDDAAASESNGPTAAAVKPRAFKFDTPEGIAEFVEWALQEQGGTMVFHWQQWGDGKVKKGFFLSYLIVYVYAYHLSILESIPPEYECSKDRPYGALLLAVQAVECDLCRWQTGEHITKTTRTRRATKFLHILKSWDDARWDALHTAVTEWLDKKKKQAGSSSRGTSEAGEMEETEDDEPEIIVLSD
ncbi:hypothetical protein B0H10DRAFT_2242312 [Mycena sp. CBHHK59/15]|nr:hypothetical protein B0H10DRAFT_2242312 [Mycena sp. CBHHK59/15]